MNSFGAAALALAIERLGGYPAFLQDSLRHPAQWMGAVLEWLESRLHAEDRNVEEQRWRGIATLAALVLVFALPAMLLSFSLRTLAYGWVAEALLATPFLAQRSLREHVAQVAAGLMRSLQEGRSAVSHIVGRNPDHLDEAGVSRAALESLAENSSDGVVAPLFWLLVAGLPGIVAYKAINTADSMIGHKSERYLHFGWAAARLDDLVNLPASRVTGLLFSVAAALCGGNPRGAWAAMWRDAAKHQSPNAGWPEAALAGALDVSLGGPRHYGSEMLDLATMGIGRSDLVAADIGRGIRLYDAALNVLLVVCVIAALAL